MTPINIETNPKLINTINALFAPKEYWEASEEVRKQVTNGCGTAGWKGELVPDSIWFLCVTAACNIHDWMYTFGKVQADKDEADDVFLNNLCRLIDAAGGPSWLKGLRRGVARDYYEAVHFFAGPAFWAGKNPASNLPPVNKETPPNDPDTGSTPCSTTAPVGAVGTGNYSGPFWSNGTSTPKV